MNTAHSTTRPTPHPDGFHGARDASILERYADPIPAGATSAIVHVQAVGETRTLLRRAGVKHIRTHAFYPVPVERDQYARLQLA